jgi:hypothetical protein
VDLLESGQIKKAWRRIQTLVPGIFTLTEKPKNKTWGKKQWGREKERERERERERKRERERERERKKERENYPNSIVELGGPLGRDGDGAADLTVERQHERPTTHVVEDELLHLTTNVHTESHLLFFCNALIEELLWVDATRIVDTKAYLEEVTGIDFIHASAKVVAIPSLQKDGHGNLCWVWKIAATYARVWMRKTRFKFLYRRKRGTKEKERGKEKEKKRERG